MNNTPCAVCGSKDVKLIDGFYYCVECGTQDANVRELLLEEKALADGTFTFKRINKVHKVREAKKEMSGEWYKWHAYNYILVGLADDLIALGAKPTFKMKLLWLWNQYVKKFQKKEELGLSQENNWDDLENCEETRGKKKKRGTGLDVAVMKKSLVLAFLYAALNLDNSDIQFSDLYRFICEGRFNVENCERFIPKEIKVSLIPEWKTFHRSKVFAQKTVKYIISLLKCLNVTPQMPNLRSIVDRYTKELCLPNDFKDLVFSLMHLCPCDHLEIDKSIMKHLVRIPSYEITVMTYIVLALKMCFGLDGDYEAKLSDAVDKINDENCYMKSHKLGTYSEASNRLFSFREWCQFLQLRKIILSKYNVQMAEKYFFKVDDYVYMEQNLKHNAENNTPTISHEIVMNILEKIPQTSHVQVIPKSEFKPTLTPLTTYTELIVEYINDPDIRLLVSEDFTQYSMKYACRKLYLQGNDSANIVIGVDDSKKVLADNITGSLTDGKYNSEKIYVRNCENKNWVKTNQPTAQHIKKDDKKSASDKNSDHGYDSNCESASNDSVTNSKSLDVQENETVDEKLEIMKEEADSVNIFDDDFVDLTEEKEIDDEEPPDIKEEPLERVNSVQSDFYADNDFEEDKSQCTYSDYSEIFNPETFDREKTIRELILAECKKYKVSIPPEYNTKEPRKRKANFVKDASGVSEPKRQRPNDDNIFNRKKKKSTTKDKINDLLVAYYQLLKEDVVFQLSEQVKVAVGNAQRIEEEMNEINVDDPTPLHEADQSCQDDNVAPTIQENVEGNVDRDESASVQLLNETDVRSDEEDTIDPRFDPKVYDIKQLYVKVGNESSDSEDAFDEADDPDIAKIIDKQIEVMTKNEVVPPTLQHKDDSDDSDDDIPLSELKEEKVNMLKKQEENEKNAKMNFEPLVKNKVGEFKYWMRFYKSVLMGKCADMNLVFHKELDKCFPKSFYFILNECAVIIECSPFQLYKSLLRLEERIMT